jgi:hypothetical protein
MLFHSFRDVRGSRQFYFLQRLKSGQKLFAVTQNSDVTPHQIADLRKLRGRRGFLSVIRECARSRVARYRGQRAGQRCRFVSGGRRVFTHRFAGTRAEDQPLQEGIAGEAIGSVHASVCGFARGVETWNELRPQRSVFTPPIM